MCHHRCRCLQLLLTRPLQRLSSGLGDDTPWVRVRTSLEPACASWREEGDHCFTRRRRARIASQRVSSHREQLSKDSQMMVRDAWWSHAPPRQQHDDDGGAHAHSIDRHRTALQCRHRRVHQHSRACSLPVRVAVCAEIRITVIRVACIAPHVASQASSIFGVATRRCVRTIVCSLEPSVSHDVMVSDGYIACSATIWTGYLLAPHVGAAD
jgi:hypothetical protein